MKNKILFMFLVVITLLVLPAINVNATGPTLDADKDVAVIIRGDAKTYYDNIDTATSALLDGDTLQLLKPLSSASTITISKSITLDLNGQNITSTATTAITVDSDKTVTIKGNGTVSGSNLSLFVKLGKVILNGGTFTSTGTEYATIQVGSTNSSTKGELVINAGATVISNDETDKMTININYQGSKVTVNGGNVSSKNTAAIASSQNVSETIIELNGGVVSSESNKYAAVQVGNTGSTGSKLIVNSGATVRGGNAAVSAMGTNSQVTINGGTITASGFAVTGNGSLTENSTILIKGGNLTSTGNAAIYHPQTGTLTIEGGNITGAIGIVARQGDININGGTITANGEGEISTGDAGGSDNRVKLPSGVAVVVDNKSTDGYEDVSKVSITDGVFNATADESLTSLGDTKEDFAVDGGEYSAPFDREFVTAGKTEVSIEDSGDKTYYVGKTAEKAVKEIAKKGNATIEVLQGDLDVTNAAPGITVKNLGSGEVSVNGQTVTTKNPVTIEPEKDDTPKTGINDLLGVSIVLVICALSGIVILKKSFN